MVVAIVEAVAEEDVMVVVMADAEDANDGKHDRPHIYINHIR